MYSMISMDQMCTKILIVNRKVGLSMEQERGWYIYVIAQKDNGKKEDGTQKKSTHIPHHYDKKLPREKKYFPKKININYLLL